MNILAMIVFTLCVAATAAATTTVLYSLYREARRGDAGATALLLFLGAILTLAGFGWSSEVLFK